MANKNRRTPHTDQKGRHDLALYFTYTYVYPKFW